SVMGPPFHCQRLRVGQWRGILKAGEGKRPPECGSELLTRLTYGRARVTDLRLRDSLNQRLAASANTTPMARDSGSRCGAVATFNDLTPIRHHRDSMVHSRHAGLRHCPDDFAAVLTRERPGDQGPTKAGQHLNIEHFLHAGFEFQEGGKVAGAQLDDADAA